MSIPINNLILDMDGVLWRGETPMPGLVDFFTTLDDAGIGYILATNNATKTAVMYSGAIASFRGHHSTGKILTSAEATATYLAGLYQNPVRPSTSSARRVYMTP